VVPDGVQGIGRHSVTQRLTRGRRSPGGDDWALAPACLLPARGGAEGAAGGRGGSAGPAPLPSGHARLEEDEDVLSEEGGDSHSRHY
jgi:hypothetical protein